MFLTEVYTFTLRLRLLGPGSLLRALHALPLRLVRGSARNLGAGRCEGALALRDGVRSMVNLIDGVPGPFRSRHLLAGRGLHAWVRAASNMLRNFLGV